MSSHASAWFRATTKLTAVLAVFSLAAAPAAAQDPASPSAADVILYPLPPSITVLGPDIPTVSVEPISSESLEIGEPIEFELGHCGLYSPVDLDGSLWQAVGGVTPSGDPITEDDDAVMGELINATPGVFVIVAEDAAHFTTATGTILSFKRAPGALDFPPCM